MKLLKFVSAFLASVAAMPTVASAASTSNPHLTVANNQIWLMLIAALVPLITYVINHVGPWVTEPIKAGVVVVVAAIAGGLDTALTTNRFGWNAVTAQLVLTAVFSALVAHHLLWKPAGISAVLGGGTNRAPRGTPVANPPGPSQVH